MPDPVPANTTDSGAQGAATPDQGTTAVTAAPVPAKDSLAQALDAVNATSSAPAAAPTPVTSSAPGIAVSPAAEAAPAAKAETAQATPGMSQSELPAPAAPVGNAPLGIPDAPGLTAGTGNATVHVTPPEFFGMDSGLMHTGFATAAWLCLLLGVIFLAYWLLRRFGPSGLRRTHSAMTPRLAGRLMLGPKQSVAVVKVLDRVLVLGATERQITLLHSQTIDECRHLDEEEDEHAFTQFAEMLSKKQDDGGDA